MDYSSYFLPSKRHWLSPRVCSVITEEALKLLGSCVFSREDDTGDNGEGGVEIFTFCLFMLRFLSMFIWSCLEIFWLTIVTQLFQIYCGIFNMTLHIIFLLKF